MLQLVQANLAHHARRYVATIVAVAISVAFVSASLLFGGALNSGIREQVAGDYSGSAAVVSVDYGSVDDGNYPDLNKAMDVIGTLPDVTEVFPLGSYGFTQDGPAQMWIPVGIVGEGELHATALASGTLPKGAGEALIGSAALERLHLDVGSIVSLEDDEGQAAELRIVGVFETPRVSLGLGGHDLLIPVQTMLSLAPTWQPSEILVATDNPKPSVQTQEQVVQTVTATLSDAGIEGVNVATTSATVDDALASINASQAALTLMLLLFPVISAVVAMIVVGTTFQVIFRQREREMALLRVIGATGKQVRRLMILESLAVGLIGSALGILIGVLGGAGIAAGVGVVASFTNALASVSLVQLLIVLAVGTVLTGLAGFRPALRASRVSPVTALAGDVVTVAAMSRKQVVIGIISGVVTVALGVFTALRAFGVEGTDEKIAAFPLVLLGSVLTAAALIVFLSAMIPLMTRALGRLGTGEGLRLAAANTGRSPGRTAATGVAIFIGVALISMVTLGAQSLRVTAKSTLDESAPVDLIVSTSETGFTAAQLSSLETLAGIEASVLAQGAAGSVQVGDETYEAALIEDLGLDTVARGEVTNLADGQVAVPSWIISEPQDVEVCVEGQCRTLEAVADDALADGTRFVVSAQTLSEFGVKTAPTQVWLKLDNPDEYPTVVSEIQELGPELDVNGAVAIRAVVDQIVNVLVMVVVGLLAVSVLVALVGITNTLSLSVAERTKENGLLRALGMTRKQVRAMLSWESLLIAGVATTAGLAAGAYFGIVGFVALPLGLSNYLISVPWVQWAAIVVVAFVAALGASVVPGRRASMVSPVEALAAQ